MDHTGCREDIIDQGEIVAAAGTDQDSADAWSGVGPSYAQSFAHLCAGAIAPLLEATAGILGPLSGRRLADVGCGNGNLAAVAIELGADVTGVDPDAGMLSMARVAAPQADLLPGGLPDLPLPSSDFDAVLANFVINHLGDPRAAVAELIRICRPRGAVGVTIWPSELSAINTLWADVVNASGVTAAGQEGLPVEKDFDRTEPGVRELLQRAGLEAVQTRTLSWEFMIDAEDLWAGPVGGVGGIGKMVRSQAPSVQAAMHWDYLRLVSPITTDGKVVLPAVALLGVGQVPHKKELLVDDFAVAVG